MPSTGKQDKPGRPKKDVKMRDFPIYTFAPNEQLYDAMKQAAEDTGMTLSAWARFILVQAVQGKEGGQG